MVVLKNFFEWFLQFLRANSDWFGDVPSIINLIFIVIGGMFALYRFLYDRKIPATSVLNAREELSNKSLNTVEAIKTEPIFFDEPNDVKYMFYRKFPINCRGKSIRLKKIYRKSYLLTGDAGCGKSALLKYDFLLNHRKKKKNVGFFFLNSVDLIDYIDNHEKQDSIVNCFIKCKYKKIFLYLDGLDEIGESRCQDLYDFINRMYIPKKTIIKVTSRSEFAEKHIVRSHLFHRIRKHISIARWTASSLRALAMNLLNHLSKNQYVSLNKISDVHNHIAKDASWKKHINSPLLMKLYIYLKLQTDLNTTIRLENRFAFYDQFVTTLTKTYYRRKNEPLSQSSINTKLTRISEIVFSAFSTGEKTVKIPNNICIIHPILKNVSSGDYSFAHETFYEYYVAKYYLTVLNNNTIDKKMVFVLQQNYSNDFADFITDAIKTNSEPVKKMFFDNLCSIYFFTLSDKSKELYIRTGLPCNKLPYWCFSSLDSTKFFSLKYEIVFRMGRMELNDYNTIVRFLEFVYYNDTNTKQTQHADYFVSVLKRCCAISSSFLSGEEIELDYVNHMLPFLSNMYDSNYDLANRSHTLLFYGDVVNKTIFNFFDDDTGIPCHNSFNKRISRLRFQLNNKLALMDKKSKKIYLFRLFDLATVYTFMYNRKQKLTSKEFNVIKNCQIDFDGASENRTALMKRIKEEIIALNKVINKAI